MVRQFRGCDSFCAKWKEQIDAEIARKNGAGGKVVLDQFYAIFKMGAACGEHTFRDVENMSDDELADELTSHLATLLPQVLVDASDN